MDLRKKIPVVAIAFCFLAGSRAHLLPQALEDVHAFVQAELNQGRSQGGSQLDIDTPPQGGSAFQTTQTYIGTPVVIQKEVFLDGKNGFQKFVDDLNIGASQIILDRTGPTSGGDPELARGLVPPSPIITQQSTLQLQDAAASTQIAQVIPANLVGPSTFVSNAEQATASSQIIQRNQVKNSQRDVPLPQSRPKKMDGWVPLDQEGTRIAKAVGAQLQGDSEPATLLDESVSYKNVGYSPKTSANEVDAATTTVQVDNLVIGTNSHSASKKLTAKYPVYPGSNSAEKPHPKVVIHAQNVIIRDNLPENSPEAANSPAENSTSGNIQQFQAYSKVPQLNNFLRDQLRIAAMNQLLQSQIALQAQEPLPLPPLHPLSDKAFPPSLSPTRNCSGARNGHFPPSLIEPQPSASSMMSFNIPHFVRMSPDARPLASIQSHSKIPFPGGLGAIYRNLLQNSGGGGSSLFDPREPLDHSLLAALSGQRQKSPRFIPPPHFKSARPDYGDGVAYKFTENPETPEDSQDQDKQKPHIPPITIVSAEPSRPPPPPPPPLGGGSLSQISDDLLKQLIIEELDNSNSNPLLPSSNPFYGGRPQPPRGRRPSRPFPYGTNAHPFSFLNGGGPDSDIQESYNSYGSAGPSDTTSTYIFEGDDDISYGGSPGGPPPPSGGDYDSSDSEPGIMPLTKETMMSLGKSLFHQALDFSKNHNPLTFIQRVRKLPPVKFELYKMPVGIPEGMVNTLSGKQRGPPSHAPPSNYGPPPPRSYRPSSYGPPPRNGGKKKHYTRKYRF
ncbi:hypothetical protein Ocin01_14087 [Orchesella cincta]|uniref:Uncharacterized protein n=1 Tax=Orchesella cincta TaxID=48709 RepID=A0A1D2MI41_ORCCI|nr:hypothetical protein Ocin01_14087 [Orchesella cincta]